MTEAHIHGFANRLKCNIIMIDERSHQLSIFEYKPGYSLQSQLSTCIRESKERRVGRGAGEAQPKRQKADATPLWVSTLGADVAWPLHFTAACRT